MRISAKLWTGTITKIDWVSVTLLELFRHYFFSVLISYMFSDVSNPARSVQKIITIPAGMQGVANPCPRVEHPVWVKRLLQDKFSTVKQMSIKTMFRTVPKKLAIAQEDAEDNVVSEPGV